MLGSNGKTPATLPRNAHDATVPDHAVTNQRSSPLQTAATVLCFHSSLHPAVLHVQCSNSYLCGQQKYAYRVTTAIYPHTRVCSSTIDVTHPRIMTATQQPRCCRHRLTVTQKPHMAAAVQTNPGSPPSFPCHRLHNKAARVPGLKTKPPSYLHCGCCSACCVHPNLTAGLTAVLPSCHRAPPSSPIHPTSAASRPSLPNHAGNRHPICSTHLGCDTHAAVSPGLHSGST